MVRRRNILLWTGEGGWKLRRGNETGNEKRGKELGKLQGREADPKRGGRAGRQADKEGGERLRRGEEK